MATSTTDGNKQHFEKQLEAQLDKYDAQINELKARAKKADAERRIELNRKLDELDSLRESAGRKLEEVKSAGADAWDDLRTSAEGAWKSLRLGIESATDRFRDIGKS